jgi:hypothetical protein
MTIPPDVGAHHIGSDRSVVWPGPYRSITAGPTGSPSVVYPPASARPFRRYRSTPGQRIDVVGEVVVVPAQPKSGHEGLTSGDAPF